MPEPAEPEVCAELARPSPSLRRRVLLDSAAEEELSSDSVAARPIDSVVLPEQLQRTLIEDLDDFHSRETRSFYVQHGIPHKRSYLFHGSPGSGKTSTIQALAGRYGRNVCYLAISPEMSDDKLKSAIMGSTTNVTAEDVPKNVEI